MVKHLPAMRETWVRFLGWKIPWRRKWLPTQVFLPGESHGQRNLVGSEAPLDLPEITGTSRGNPGFPATPRERSHGIFQARILEWVAISFSRGSSNPGIEPRSPVLQVDSLPAKPPGKPKNTGVGNLCLLQQIFPLPATASQGKSPVPP